MYNETSIGFSFTASIASACVWTDADGDNYDCD